MAIQVSLRSPLRRKAKDVEAEWRESYRREVERFIAEYCEQHQRFLRQEVPYFWDEDYGKLLDFPLIRKCPHGVYIGAAGQFEGTARFRMRHYCTVCYPWDVRRHKRNGFVVAVEKWQHERKKTNLSKPFPRHGGYQIERYVSPYDEHHRMRAEEGCGGYIRSGPNDGVGIRASLGYDADGLNHRRKQTDRFTVRIPGPEELVLQRFANAETGPDEFDLTLYRSPLIVVPRLINDYRPTPALSLIGQKQQRTTRQWWREHTADELSKAKKTREALSERAEQQLSATLQQDSEAKCKCSRRFRDWPQTNLVPICEWSWSEKWSDKWRTERPMRDLAARLNMYAYGSNGETVQLEKMMATAWENLRRAQKNLEQYAAVPRRPPASDTYPNFCASA